MARACRIVVDTLDALEAAAVPGITTKEMDRIAREQIEKAGARPAFLGYRGYPATLCISVNEEVVHGIPGPRRLKDGDVVGLDLGCIVDGFFGDAARTVGGGQRERRGAAADGGDARGAVRRHRRVPARASASATSATRCRRSPSAAATRWCASSSATGSAPASTRSRRCRTTGRRGGASGWCRECAWRSSRWSTWGAPRSRCWRTAGRRSRATAACRRTSSCRWRSRAFGPWILSEPYPYAQEAAHA